MLVFDKPRAILKALEGQSLLNIFSFTLIAQNNFNSM